MKLAAMLVCAALTVAAPVAQQHQHQEEDLSSPKLRVAWAEFKKLYDAKKIEVVDVRGDAAFEAGHIPGARSVPLDTVERRAEELKKLGKPIITYCA